MKTDFGFQLKFDSSPKKTSNQLQLPAVLFSDRKASKSRWEWGLSERGDGFHNLRKNYPSSQTIQENLGTCPREIYL